MRLRITMLALFTALMLVVQGAAFAKKPARGDVQGVIQAYVITVDESGEEQKVEAEEAQPGQIMEFQIVFTNEGNSDVNGVTVANPIPEHTTFIGDSESTQVSSAFEVSIDGGVTFQTEPVMREIRADDGSAKEVVVPPEEYTHLRWLSNEVLASNGGQQVFTYRVAVD